MEELNSYSNFEKIIKEKCLFINDKIDLENIDYSDFFNINNFLKLKIYIFIN